MPVCFQSANCSPDRGSSFMSLWPLNPCRDAYRRQRVWTIGAALRKWTPSQPERVVAHASRTLLKCERNYSTTEKRMHGYYLGYFEVSTLPVRTPFYCRHRPPHSLLADVVRKMDVGLFAYKGTTSPPLIDPEASLRVFLCRLLSMLKKTKPEWRLT